MSDDPVPPVKPFRQVATIGGKTTFALKAFIVVAALCVVGEVWFLATIDDSYFTDEMKPAEVFVGIIALVYVAVFLAVVICFCRWKHRTYSNLPALDSPAPRYSPNWAVGSYFVPILNLFRPFRAMKDIWNGTLRRDLETSVPTINYWWIAWMASAVIENASARLELRAETVAQVQAARGISVVSDMADVIAAILLIKVVSAITTAQTSAAGHAPSAEPLYGDDLPADGR